MVEEGVSQVCGAAHGVTVGVWINHLLAQQWGKGVEVGERVDGRAVLGLRVLLHEGQIVCMGLTSTDKQ